MVSTRRHRHRRTRRRSQRGGDVANLLDSRLSNTDYIIPAGTLTSRNTPRFESVAAATERRTTPPFARKRKTRGRGRSRSRQTKRR